MTNYTHIVRSIHSISFRVYLQIGIISEVKIRLNVSNSGKIVAMYGCMLRNVHAKDAKNREKKKEEKLRRRRSGRL